MDKAQKRVSFVQKMVPVSGFFVLRGMRVRGVCTAERQASQGHDEPKLVLAAMYGRWFLRQFSS